MYRCTPASGPLLALAALMVLGGCAEEPAEVPPRAPGPALARVTLQQFGDAAEPDEVVATVDGDAITVGELAICLQAAPIRGVEGCLDDLVDAALAARQALPEDAASPRVADARLAAQASALLRERIEAVVTAETLPAEEVAAFGAQPGHRLYVAGPELRQCSHLLVRTEDGRATPASRELAERIRRSLDDVAGHATASDLAGARRAFTDDARSAGLTLRVEEHLLGHADNADPSRWPNLPVLAQPFVDALFVLEGTGDLSEPVDTDFGTHVILLERIFPASALSPEAADALLRHELAQRQRFEALGNLLGALGDASEVVRYNAVELFRLDDEAIIQERNASLRQSIGARGP